jgi:hypothetical protein
MGLVCGPALHDEVYDTRMESRRNDDWEVKPKYSEENLSHCHFVNCRRRLT